MKPLSIKGESNEKQKIYHSRNILDGGTAFSAQGMYLALLAVDPAGAEIGRGGEIHIVKALGDGGIGGGEHT